MAKKFDCVELMRRIRSKLNERYARSRQEELQELREMFGYLRDQMQRRR
jgi:hypothetical protein